MYFSPSLVQTKRKLIDLVKKFLGWLSFAVTVALLLRVHSRRTVYILLQVTTNFLWEIFWWETTLLSLRVQFLSSLHSAHDTTTTQTAPWQTANWVWKEHEALGKWRRQRREKRLEEREHISYHDSSYVLGHTSVHGIYWIASLKKFLYFAFVCGVGFLLHNYDWVHVHT